MKILIEKQMGYVKNIEGNVISKFNFPIGEHNFPEGSTITYLDTETQLALIEIYKDPLTQDELDAIEVARLITEKTKDLAIAELKKEDKLDADGKLKK